MSTLIGGLIASRAKRTHLRSQHLLFFFRCRICKLKSPLSNNNDNRALSTAHFQNKQALCPRHASSGPAPSRSFSTPRSIKGWITYFDSGGVMASATAARTGRATRAKARKPAENPATCFVFLVWGA